MPNIIIDLVFIFLFALVTLFCLRKVARHIGLVDKPSERKHHSGQIPLIGGLSICISLLYFLYEHPDIFPNTHIYAVSITVLVGIGVLDDKYDISFKLRMAVQAGLAIVMMQLAGVELVELGDMFGFGQVSLPNYLDQVITVLAVIGAINAFNMVDGIDGLLGGLASVTFAALGYLFFIHGMTNIAYLCATFIVVMLPYILFNLGAFGRARKVFMGDAGSMLIGFTVIWLLIIISQPIEGKQMLRPVTALWLIALPLLDMTAIMIRRVRRGDSPFKPDREHLHHIFQRVGLNPTQTLLLICAIAASFAAIGIYGEAAQIPEAIMFYAFIAIFIVYTVLLSKVWKVTAIIRRLAHIRRVS